MGCRACLGLWLIVLVRRLCYCLQNRVRSRWASGTRALSGDVSDLCTRLDPGGNIVDGLASRGGGPSAWAFSFLEGRVEGLRPGTRPAHPGPAHRRTSAVAFQVPRELLGSVLAAAAWGGRSSSLSSSGTCGPPYRSPRIPGPVPHAVHHRITDHFPGCSSPGTVAR